MRSAVHRTGDFRLSKEVAAHIFADSQLESRPILQLPCYAAISLLNAVEKRTTHTAGPQGGDARRIVRGVSGEKPVADETLINSAGSTRPGANGVAPSRHNEGYNADYAIRVPPKAGNP